MNKYLLLIMLSSVYGMVCAQDTIHTSKIGNLSGQNTQLSIDTLHNNPKAILVAIPLEETKHLLKSPVGVWNNGVYCYVFNTDKTPMPGNVKFKIMYSPVTDSAHFLFQADIYHLKGNVAYLNKPSLNGKPDAVIFASMCENPTGVYEPKEIAFKYDEAVNQWFVYNVDGSPIKKDLGLSIIVKKPGSVKTKTNIPTVKDTTKNILNPVITNGTLTLLVTKDVEFPNWDFERGLTGWGKDGTAFNNQPTRGDNISTQRVMYNMEYNNGGVGGDYWKDQGVNQGYKHDHWIGTYENNPNRSNF